MKQYTFLILLLFAFSLSGQQIQYVNADNGLIIRSKPDRTGDRIGKLSYGSGVKVIKETDIQLQVKDGEQIIMGAWTEIEEVNGSLKGFVFNGYLSDKAVEKRTEVIIEDFLMRIKTGIHGIFRELDMTATDSISTYLDLGETIQGQKITINQSKFKKVEIFQRHQNTARIQAESEFCALDDWKHYYSDWKELEHDPETLSYMTIYYGIEDWEKFIPVDIKDYKEAVQESCGPSWAKRISNINNTHQYPSDVTLSRIDLKILLTDRNGRVRKKIISFGIPMGC